MKSIVYSIFLLLIISISAYSQKTPKVDFAKNIQEATPQSLPQSPIAIKLKSDAADDNLKSKVKSVVEEDLEEGENIRQPSKETYYSEGGNLIKIIMYSGGRPLDVTVFGYLDGDRVSSSKIVVDNGNPNRMTGVANTGSAPEKAKARDKRYSFKYKYRYDEKGQIAENWMYQNNGELSSRSVYNYKNNQKETITYDADGKVNWRSVEVLDKNGNTVEENWFDTQNKVFISSVHEYVLDKQGNWVIQKSFDKEIEQGKTVLKPSSTSYRTITYYP